MVASAEAVNALPVARRGVVDRLTGRMPVLALLDVAGDDQDRELGAQGDHQRGPDRGEWAQRDVQHVDEDVGEPHRQEDGHHGDAGQREVAEPEEQQGRRRAGARRRRRRLGRPSGCAATRLRPEPGRPGWRWCPRGSAVFPSAGSAMAESNRATSPDRSSSEDGPTLNWTCISLPSSLTSSRWMAGGASAIAWSMSTPVGGSGVAPGTSRRYDSTETALEPAGSSLPSLRTELSSNPCTNEAICR